MVANYIENHNIPDLNLRQQQQQTLFSYIKYTNIQISHHLQIARLIEAGGVWTA